MNTNKTDSMLNTPFLLTNRLLNSVALCSIILAPPALANNINPDPSINCDGMTTEMPLQLNDAIVALRETQRLNSQNQIDQYTKQQLGNLSERKPRTIGRHIIGSLFAVVDAVDKLGGDTISLVSRGVNKLNDATIDKLSGGSFTTNTLPVEDSHLQDDSYKEKIVSHEALIQQLLLTGKFNHLLSNTNGKDISINHQSFTHRSVKDQPSINRIENYPNIYSVDPFGNSCPIRHRAISM